MHIYREQRASEKEGEMLQQLLATGDCCTIEALAKLCQLPKMVD